MTTMTAQPAAMHAPHSVSLRYGGDVRMPLLLGQLVVMQLADPKVGAGVVQHSAFRQAPWARAREISESGLNMMYRGHEAALAEGQRLRELHRGIKGVDAHGERYHALNPDTYGWVHFCFLDNTLRGHELLANGVPPQDRLQLFEEWRESGRYFGLRDQDMPATLAEYERTLRERLHDTLEYNEAIGWILSTDKHLPPPPPKLSALPAPLWRALAAPLFRRQVNLSLGALPRALRKKFEPHIVWSDADQALFERQCRRIRRLVNALPARLRYQPAAWRAMHGKRV